MQAADVGMHRIGEGRSAAAVAAAHDVAWRRRSRSRSRTARRRRSCRRASPDRPRADRAQAASTSTKPSGRGAPEATPRLNGLPRASSVEPLAGAQHGRRRDQGEPAPAAPPSIRRRVSWFWQDLCGIMVYSVSVAKDRYFAGFCDSLALSAPGIAAPHEHHGYRQNRGSQSRQEHGSKLCATRS